jgi:DNA-binding transcriptional ArsR family regulator
MPNQVQPLDQVFKALADPTRRAVMERLGMGRAAVSELIQPFDMALPSFLQHLSMLERSGLVRSHKDGRVRTYEVVTERFALVEDWMAEQRRQWKARFGRLDDYLQELQGQSAPNTAALPPSQSSTLKRRRPAAPTSHRQHPRKRKRKG